MSLALCGKSWHGAGVMAWLLVILALMAPWLLGLRRSEIVALQRLDQLVRRIEIAIRAGAIDPWRQIDPQDAAQFSQLGAALRQARYAGHPMLVSLTALRRLVTRSCKRAQRRYELTQLVRLRISLIVALAAAGRMLILKLPGAPQIVDTLDHCYLLLAIVASASAVMLFCCKLPNSWLWQTQLKPEVLSWLHAHLGLAAPGFSLPDLSLLSRKELTTGVCLTAEKRRVLVHWAQEQGRHEAEAYRRCLEILPLFEIIVFGLIAGLILAGPALAAWENSLDTQFGDMGALQPESGDSD